MWQIFINVLHCISEYSPLITAFFAGVMLCQLSQTDNWNRKNNVLTHFSYVVFKEFYDDYSKALIQYRGSISMPISAAEVMELEKEENWHMAVRIIAVLNFFEGMCKAIDAKVADEGLCKSLYRRDAIKIYKQFGVEPIIHNNNGEKENYLMLEKYAKRWGEK